MLDIEYRFDGMVIEVDICAQQTDGAYNVVPAHVQNEVLDPKEAGAAG